MKKNLLLLAGIVIVLVACVRPANSTDSFIPAGATSGPSTQETAALGQLMSTGTLPAPIPTALLRTPTPDQPKTLPTPRAREEKYTVQPNDTLGIISRKYGVDIDLIVSANKPANPNLLSVGQVLTIPVAPLKDPGPAFKIIPDSELVLGPKTTGFSIQDFVAAKKGYLAQYVETVDERSYSGAQVIERVAQEYSVNPRLLLAVLEYQSGWVTHPTSPDNRRDYPMGRVDAFRKGLYKQMAWAANMLNRGYYLWRVNGISSLLMTDGSLVPIAPQINAGTAGVQHFFSTLSDLPTWEQAVTEKGLFATYNQLFGYPFNYSFEPVLPVGLTQPKMQLPFEPGVRWSFTGGPHGGWGDGSAWAAIDFGPPEEGGGCRISNAWVVAVADGVIVHSDLGAVIQDLDGDGNERTGWSILYMHIQTTGRVAAGTRLKAGERIGHPSCEGGVSNGTHTHIARRYNGEWIPADGSIPFNLDGWISEGTGTEYYGSLKRNGKVLEAWDTKTTTNQIER
jgi:murein DD-endopeptidase MepM/ murein hydrolase activator NlpD